MQSLHILGRSIQAFRRIGTLPVYRLRKAYPCVQHLNYSVSTAKTESYPDELSSQARIHKTLKTLTQDLNILEASVVDKSEKQNERAYFICEQLQKLHKSTSKDKISADGIHVKQIQELFRSIKSDPSSLSTQNVIGCVTAYVQLSLAVCSDEAEKNDCLNLEEYSKFEVHVKDNLDSTSLHDLVLLYNTYFECRLRHPQNVIFLACEKLLRERAPKATHSDELISLCKLVDDGDKKQLWESVENCVSLSLDKMSIQQLLSCLHSLVCRNSPSKANRQLHSKLICKILEHEMPTLQVGHLSFVTWAMKKLGMADAEVLQKLCEKIMQTKPSRDNEKSGRDAMKCCYILSNLDRFQWAHKDVFDLVVARLLILHPRSHWVDSVRQVLINAANLNIRLGESRQLIQRHVTSQKKVKDVYKQVNLLWALCAMGEQGMVSKEIEDLFHPVSLKSIKEDKPSKVLNHLRKLRDIAMTMEMPLGSLTFLSELKRLEKQRKSGSFENGVFHIIENSLPEGSYCKNVVTPAGHKIDIELYVNDSGEAVKLTDQMPEIHRIAVKTRGYFTMSKPNNLPLGWVLMENRNLVKEGYRVLEIPYYEWLKHSTSATRSAFINKRIKEVVLSQTRADTN